MQHFEWLDPNGERASELLSEYTHIVLEVASALYDKNKYAQALRFYEPLWDVPDALDANALLSADARLELARMYEAAREEREAYILVSEALKLQEAQEEEEPLDGDMDANVDDMDEEELDPPNLSLDRDPGMDAQRKKKPARRVVRMRRDKPKTKAQKPLRSLQPKVQRQRPRVFGYSEEVHKEEERRAVELATKWQIVRDSREESGPNDRGPPASFMAAAGPLVDDFRSYKDFYSWDNYLTHLGIKQASQKPVTRNPNLVEMAERLSHNLGPGEFGPTKPTSESDRFTESYKVCESARDAVIFSNSKEDMFLIHVTWAACALRGRDEETCVAMARYFTSKHQFDTDAFRIFAALSRLCPSPASWYASGPVQKFLLRQIRIMDTTLVPKQAKMGREQSPSEEAEAEAEAEVEGATYPGKEPDATLLTLYGHVLFISNSFTYALNYLLRALSIDPTNTMIALSIGQCYIQDGLKRQSDNRQYLIAQGFAFLHRYYDARISSPLPLPSAAAAERQEAHYNLARTYHSVGIPHLAAEYYRRALQEGERVVDGDGNGDGDWDMVVDGGGGNNIMGSQDISREAAFNLQQLCLAGGDLETVRAVGERFLVI
ncbi:putative rna polymerase iii transcription factor tfiiic protein [Eutypa lata UCREL1]|uniref:Putative rna polymerase iii transcription factor tfiiic protein n=1 Tax=Eutypa lata (strain UCR-EL1) TaxID=1287681 RepID=M7TXU6_EUTLA|nr:putative rna polymerase iii transcription factor tfiiic protein [Eutypa lata UCREL1]